MARYAFLVAVVLVPFAGCSTSETVTDSFEIDVPNGDRGTILDTQLKVLADLAREYPKRADLQYKLAAVQFRKEDFRESAKHLRKAIYLDPNHVRYHYDLGRVHLQMGEYEEAEAAFRKAVEVGGRKRWSGLNAALGYTLCHLKRWDDAAEQFRTCIAIDGSDPTPYYFLGSIADIKSDTEKAVRYLQTYIERGGKTFRRRAVEVLRFHGVRVDGAALVAGDMEALETDTNTALSGLPLLDPGVEEPAPAPAPAPAPGGPAGGAAK